MCCGQVFRIFAYDYIVDDLLVSHHRWHVVLELINQRVDIESKTPSSIKGTFVNFLLEQFNTSLNPRLRLRRPDKATCLWNRLAEA